MPSQAWTGTVLRGPIETDPHASQIKCWRYYLPSQVGEGWVLAWLDAFGFFSVVSDYGNYAYKWSQFGEDFREFFCGLDSAYVAGKICKNRSEYSGSETEEAIKRYILQKRRNQDWDKEHAAIEWDTACEADFSSSEGFSEWYRQTDIDDAHEYAVYDIDWQTRMFCEKALPRLQRFILDEMVKENIAKEHAEFLFRAQCGG